MKNTIPTAEEFFFNYSVNDEYDNLSKRCKEEIIYKTIEFAKLHVEAALKAASEKAKTTWEDHHFENNNKVVSKQSILNAYPLILIK